jgi:outer membrane receptor for ferrienterochelin and colicins
MLLEFAQAQQSHLKIVDAKSGETIPAAHVCTENTDKSKQQFYITNPDGTVLINSDEKVLVAISFIGYISVLDTIYPGKNYTFKLEPNSKELSEVVVTGQIRPETCDKSIYNIQVINSMQIENKAANNLGELLMNELNVNVGNSGILGTSIQMQGLSGEHIKILIDGVPVIGRQNGNIDLGQLNLQNVDHIEIVEGPMSVVYGSNALAGAINIITKKNARPKFHINIDSYNESVGISNQNATLLMNRNNQNFSISAGRNFFDGYNYVDVGQRTFTFNPKEQYNSAFEYGITKPKFSATLKQELFRETLINNGSKYYSGNVYIDSTYYTIPLADDENYITNRYNTKTDFTYKISDKSLINFMAAYSYYNRIKKTYHKNLYDLTEELSADTSKHDTTLFNAINSRASYSKVLNKIEFQSGYDLIIETGNGKRIINTQRIDDYAAFFSLKYNPYNKLSLQGGTRFIYNTQFKAPLVYSINAKWNPITNFNIRASYGKGFRSPSIKELYLHFIDVNHEVLGNADLKAEYSENYNLAFNYKTENGKNSHEFNLKFYHNKIKNKIDFLYDSINASKADYINIDGIYKTIGGQFDVTYRLHPRFEFKTGFNYYGKSKYVNLNQYTFTPDYTASLNYHNMRYLFRINIFYKYNGKQSQFYEAEENGEKIVEERYLAAYNMLDASINRAFFNEKISIAIGAKNLLDVKTVAGTGGTSSTHGSDGEGGSSVAWGRTYFIKLNLNLNKF